MEVKIYVDVLFIINFIIDYILLSVTSFFAKKSPGIFKMSASAILGAVFASFMFFAGVDKVLSFFLTSLVAFLMILVAFGINKAGVILKNLAIFYMVSAVISGLSFGFVFSGKASKIAVNNGIFYADVNAYTFLLIFVCSVLIIHTSTGYIKKQKIKSSFLYNVTIEKNGRAISDTALFDSANFMLDPISQKSIIIAEWQSVSPLFDEDKITEVIVNHPKDFLYVGCRTLGDVVGLYAFMPDRVSSCELDFFEPVLVAVTETSLDKEGAYRMILPNTTGAVTYQERI